MKKFLILLVCSSLYLSSFSQQKIGYYSSQIVLKDNKEVKKLDSLLNEFIKVLQSSFEYLKNDYTKKVQEYKKDSANLSPSIKDIVLKDIADLDQKINNYSTKANEEFVNKRTEIYAPFLKKLDEIVGEIAKEEKYDFIIDIAVLKFSYSNPNYDLTEKVKKKLK